MTDTVYKYVNEVPPARSVFTVGAFDGVHRGHQYLITRAREAANALDARLVVITFEPLPVQVFRPDAFPGRILSNTRRRELLYEFGADVIVELPFSHELARKTASEFTDEMITAGPVLEVWMGEDFALGHNREGTPQRLQELLDEHGAIVKSIPRISFGDQELSSSAVRQCILHGEVGEASIILGHRFQITGEVVEGAKLGRTIGFPTANVPPPADIVPLHDGIYASFAVLEGESQQRPAITYVGKRPTVNTGARMIETYLIDFDGDLYGTQLTAVLVERLRPDIDFPSLEEMTAQLREDERQARAILGAAADV